MVKPYDSKTKNANSEMNYEAIRDGVEHLKGVVKEEFEKIAKKLESIDTGEHTTEKLGFIKINDHTLKGIIDQVADIIRSIATTEGLFSQLDEVVKEAEKEHDRLQNQYNEERKKEIAAEKAAQNGTAT